MKTWAERHPVATYFILAYVFSWAVEIPLAAAAQGWTSHAPPRWLHYFAGYGPLLAAVITTGLIGGRTALRDLFSRMVRWRVRPGWWLAAMFPLVLYAATIGVLRLARGSWTDPALLGRVNFLPALGPLALVLWLITYGVGEETGWRGFALPYLQRRRSALAASLVLAAGWIGWHLPTLLYLPSYQQLGFRIIPVFALGIGAGSIVFTWLYNGSGASVLMAIMFHATLNFVTSAPSGDPVVSAVVSMAVIVWAVIVVLIWKADSLAPGPRQTPVLHWSP